MIVVMKMNIYSYDGQCFKECPKYTKLSDNGKSCVDDNDNTNKCILSETKLELEGNSLFETVKIMAKNYAHEFGYIKKHVSYYYNNEYSILLYTMLD